MPVLPVDLLGNPNGAGNAVTGVWRTEKGLWTPVYVAQGNLFTIRFQTKIQIPGFATPSYDSVLNAAGGGGG